MGSVVTNKHGPRSMPRHTVPLNDQTSPECVWPGSQPKCPHGLALEPPFYEKPFLVCLVYEAGSRPLALLVTSQEDASQASNPQPLLFRARPKGLALAPSIAASVPLCDSQSSHC